MTQTIRQQWQAFTRAMSSPSVIYYALPWLMCLLVAGTVAQRYIGLYPSQKLFFGSFVLWLGPVPVPGAYSMLALVALSMTLKLALHSPLKKEYSGIIIAHASVLVLLLGGLVTAIAREEGYILLGPGDDSHTISDYQQRALSITRNGVPVISIPYDKLRVGEVVAKGALPFSLTVTQTCFPCAARAQEHPTEQMKGVARRVALGVALYSNEDAENQPGIAFDVHGSDADGTYITSELLAEQPLIGQGKDVYAIALGPVQRTLPFTVELNHFEKADYPGTQMARSYRSDVTVHDGVAAWNAAIEMNQPLRYRGYTLYQSSFVEKNGKQYTVLAVVRNAGEIFPYLAIATLCAGLLIHIAITFARGKDAA